MDTQKDAIIEAYSSQNYNNCLKLITALAADAQSSSEIRILKASCFINLEDRIAEAHTILDDILATDANNSFAFYAKGLAQLKEQKLIESVASFTRAAELDTSGLISKAQVMKLQTEKLLRESTRSKSRKRHSMGAAVSKPPATCETCNKTFAQQYSLNRHRLLHSGERPFKCTLCPSGFIEKGRLVKHMSEVHHGDKNDNKKEKNDSKNAKNDKKEEKKKETHKCDICNKEFTYKRLMKLHRITHSTRTKLTCDHCEKVFVTKPSLQAHIMSHVNRARKAREEARVDVEAEIDSTIINKPQVIENPQPEVKKVKLEPESEENLPPTPAPSPEPVVMPQSSQETVVGDGEKSPEWKFFFKSLMHDLDKMDEKQKRKFKLKTFSLIDEILE